MSPTLVLSEDKDDWTPVGMRQAAKGEADFEFVVYPGAFHPFAHPSGQPYDYLGHHIGGGADAQKRARRSRMRNPK